MWQRLNQAVRTALNLIDYAHSHGLIVEFSAEDATRTNLAFLKHFYHEVDQRIGLRPAKAGREKTHEILADLFPQETYYPVHLNLIQHGRQVCKAPRPLCLECSLTDLCEYYQQLDPKPVVE